MTAYYNENEPYAAEWLRNLITAGHIAAGEVDERDVRDVRPDDVRGFDQCHFFAGIGGWARALRLAGWPDDRPVWTGSCPCQPFSTAGKRAGFADERHLWPTWFWLIRECKPAIVFGEQVARAKVWLDLVCSDLEGEGYACGTAVLSAASVDAPHLRERLWFVADAGGTELRDESRRRSRSNGACAAVTGDDGAAEAVADATRQRIDRSGDAGARWGLEPTDSRWWQSEPDVGRVAHGVPARVGRLRAFGNAIVPAVAAEFICAYDVGY